MITRITDFFFLKRQEINMENYPKTEAFFKGSRGTQVAAMQILLLSEQIHMQIKDENILSYIAI